MRRIYAVEVIEKKLVSVSAMSRQDAMRRVNRGEGDYIAAEGEEVAVRARRYDPDKKYGVLQVRTKGRA